MVAEISCLSVCVLERITMTIIFLTKKSLVMDTTDPSIKEYKMRGTTLSRAGLMHGVMMFTGLGKVR